MQREVATATAVAVAATAAAGTAAVVSVRRVVQGGGGGGRQLRTYCSWPGSPPLLSCLSGIRSASNREPPRRSPRRGDAGGPVGRCCSRGEFRIASRCGTAMARRRGRPPASVRKAVLSARRSILSFFLFFLFLAACPPKESPRLTWALGEGPLRSLDWRGGIQCAFGFATRARHWRRSFPELPTTHPGR